MSTFKKSIGFMFMLLLVAAIAACGPAMPPPGETLTGSNPTGDTSSDHSDSQDDHSSDGTTEDTNNDDSHMDSSDDAGKGEEMMQWDEPPAMMIDLSKTYVATLKTEKGDVVVELYTQSAPATVNNFVFLAREGFYDDTTFHRVLDQFMAQAGDPTGTGMGGPGYRFEDELESGILFDRPGLLAMANAGPNTNGSQFFITYDSTPWLDGRHTIFGQVVEGLDIALSLDRRDPMQNPETPGNALISVTIEETGTSLLPPPTPTSVPMAPMMEDGRPLASIEIPQRERLYDLAPAMVIDPAKSYIATVKTTAGDMVVELDPAAAPESVNNFYILANLGYWDNFPMVFTDNTDGIILAITGSPGANPDSDVGYDLPLEMNIPNLAGTVGFWRVSADGASGSQLYFLGSDYPALDNNASPMGQIIEGIDVVGSLTMEDLILSITVEEK